MVQLNGALPHISVADFYAGKSVFITGGTGFLGKIIIEKLLYSCPSIQKIYVLIRKKKNDNAQNRVKMLMDHIVFTRIRNERPNDLRKVIAIVGDLSEPNLGLSEIDDKLLTTKVSIVIHAAATIKFNEPLDLALAINVEGTRGILNLCHRMHKIEAYVHVSTAYTNTDKKIVEEKVYPPPAPLDEVYEFVKKHKGNNQELSKFLNGRPNTYTYTKALAEYLVKMNHGKIPTSIIRPSIVLSTLKDPIAGWLENWNGPTLVMFGISKGIHRFQIGGAENVADIIPVDLVSNMTIAAAARCQRSKELQVYNCTSGKRNPINYGNFIKWYVESAKARNFNDLPFPGLFLSESVLLISILKLFFAMIPAYTVDFFLRLFGKKPLYVKILSKIRIAEDLFVCFTSNQWDFHDDNVRRLIESMSNSDRDTFYCDPVDIEWKSLIDNYFLGVSKYLLKSEIVIKGMVE